MSYKDDFQLANGWAAVDLNSRLSSRNQPFLDFLKQNHVSTIIRYYATDPENAKTLTPEEATFLSGQGFSLLPVFQDSSRSISNFTAASGVANAKSALKLARAIGQPEQAGSTILFAVDKDYEYAQIDGPILDYFLAVKQTLGSAFRIGAYGSGAVLSKLMAENLIAVPWLSMSRAFHGTESFFYSQQWALRQIPPDQKFPADKGIGYDRNILRLPPHQLGAFTLNDGGRVAGSTVLPLMTPPTFATPTDATNRVVTTDGVRLRDKPDGAVIRDMTIGEAVIDSGSSTQAGWRKVQVGNDSGVIFGLYLRELASPAIEALVQSTIAEWVRFDKGNGDERQSPYYRYIREMWAEIGEPYDGRDTKEPWSAAFISWVVKQAGKGYENFKFASGHSVFVNNAIKARLTQRLDKPFWGYRIDEEKPALGDIIQRNRLGNQYSFSWAENHVFYNSHADIVVEIKADVVRVLGGNVSNSVNMREYRLDKEGFLQEGQGIIAILKNRADAVA
ncbi:DUF2272 domain-containing protein [Leclercia adecarboxylata]|uniref:DUF2272 domain-containing protein n=1 Tax=Leclercia adecarboxylata TaxID=83655 RepID=UPI00384DFEDE